MSPTPTAAPEGPDPLVGRTIGSYKILRILGRGGMGAVYLAEHPIINSQVAIKFLHPQYAADPKVVDRFFNEARAVNLIGHPNIIKILDLNVTEDQRHYFVMEFLHGRPLSRLMRAPLGLEVAGPILLQCCAALEAAHERGIVHRDLKPDNVYLVSHLGRSHFVKIVDFGIAKLTDIGDARGHRTQTGTVMGTPAYMSPEQASGETNRIDGRSDIYSLGVMMFQMAAGRLPFEETTFGKLLICHVQQEPPAPRSINPAIPAKWERIILRSLAKEPEARQQNMAQLADELHACMEELDLSGELPLDEGTVPEGPRVAPDPGRRRSPAFISGPRITPPARRSAKPTRPTEEGPAVEPPPPVARFQTPAPPKRRTGLYLGLGAALLLSGGFGLYFLGGFNEEPAPRAVPREKSADLAAPVPVPETREQKREPAPAPVTPAPAPVAPAPAPAPPEPAAPEKPRPQLKPRRPPPAPEAPPTVRLSVVSDPPGADVIARWEGGEKRGKAPFQFDAPKGAHVKFDFFLKNYSPSQEEAVADQPRTVTAELVQLLGD